MEQWQRVEPCVLLVSVAPAGGEDGTSDAVVWATSTADKHLVCSPLDTY